NAAPHGCNVSCRDAGYDSGSCATNEKGEGYCECYDEGSICSDTDGGPNFYVGGVCSDADGDMPDRCSTIDDDILIETSCQFKEGPCVKAAVQCGKSCTAKGASGGECALDDEGLGFCRCSKRCEMQPLVIELEKDTSASSFMYGGRVLYYATDTNGIADMPDITDFNFTMATTQVTNSGSAPGTKYLEKFNSLPYKTMILEPGEFDTENYALLPDANDKLCKYIAYIADNKIGGQLYLYREGNRP
ncbi:hypothetical protein KJ891_03890, partial [Candidatus Micrarchaeota archaeon]|nr:hypothetical protein [Candidatus Micrarchaeota archaeon]